MPYFLSPKVLFGSGMLKRLASEIEGKGTKAAIITDKTMVNHCGQLNETVQGAGYKVKVWDGAEQEPSVESAQAGAKFLAEFAPKVILGFGGGSVIDSAKAAWVLYEKPEMTGVDLVSVNPKSKLGLRKKAIFIAVPTTSGTGSDATWAIVLTDSANHRKIGFANNEILPDITLLIPEFTSGMPRSLTASTGMDVLGHAMDGLTARQATDFSDGMCLQAMKLTFDWLVKACQNGDDLTARGKMQNAATIAGLGFGNSNTSLSHALGHSMGATFGIPHGRAIGIALTYSLKYITSNLSAPNAPDSVERLYQAARFAGIDSAKPEEAIDMLIRKIKELQKAIGEPQSLKDAGIDRAQFDEKLETLVEVASKDVNMYSSPCECKDDKLKKLFQEIWQG
jgi:alcohol dehydrogenase class IV